MKVDPCCASPGPDLTGPAAQTQKPHRRRKAGPPGWRGDPTCFLLLASVNPGEQLQVSAPLAPIKGRTHKNTSIDA